jgi:hypothetical protein
MIEVNRNLSVTIPDVYAMNPAVDAKNTLYIGYGPATLPLDATVDGGTASYQYNWSTGQQSASISVSNAGTYAVEVTDNKKCRATGAIEIKILDVRCGKDDSKVKICHNAKSICVAPESVQEHLNHGDHLGDCNISASRISTEILNAESTEIFDIRMYPNPVKDNLVIRTNASNENLFVQIFNSLGQRVHSIRLSNPVCTISLKGLSKGMYYVQIRSTKGVMTKKIIKE